MERAIENGIIERHHTEKTKETAGFAPKLKVPDPPQAAFDRGTSTSPRTASSSQVTSARKSGLTLRILICRVENGSDEHS